MNHLAAAIAAAEPFSRVVLAAEQVPGRPGRPPETPIAYWNNWGIFRKILGGVGSGFAASETMSKIIALRSVIRLMMAWCVAVLTALLASAPVVAAAGEFNVLLIL